MNKLTEKLQSLIPSKRKLIQLYSALLFNANAKGFITGEIFRGSSKQLCVPGLNCYSCPGAIGACPLGTLQGAFSADKSTWFYVGGILLLYCLLFGRMICGWLCPFGLIQELLYKIKTPKLRKSRVTRVLSYFKYVILVLFVFIIPIMYAFRDTPLPAFCKYICPAGTLEGGVSLLANAVNANYFSMLGPLFTWKFLLLVSIVVTSVFIFRMFCRFICPLGALYGLFNRFSVFGVTVVKKDCVNCGLCVSQCKLDVRRVGDQECIHCGECTGVCPTKAIVWKGSKLKKASAQTLGDTVKGHEKARLIARAVAAVLALALLVSTAAYAWIDSDRSNTPPIIDDTPSTDDPVKRGNAIGDLCFDASLTVISSGGATTQTIDPSATGKITIINFWGTWCTPCVKELPYFDRIATDYADTVSVIAIHTQMLIDTAPAYIAEYYPDSRITFASDLENEGYYTQLGGRGTYPYTIILDADGIVREVIFKALTYEDLQAAVENLM